MSPELQKLSKSQRALVAAELSLKQPVSDRGELAKTYDVDPARIGDGCCVLRSAEPHIIVMVREGKIGVTEAARMIRHTSSETQCKLTTPEQVKRVAREIKNEGVAPKVNGKPHEPPPSFVPWTFEESGKPPPGSSIAEHNAYDETNGRVPMFPAPIKELLNREASVGQLLHIVVRAAGASQPTADQFFADIDILLAQVRQKDARGTMEPPFADKAKRTLKELRESLPKALALFTALDEGLQARSPATAKPAPAPVAVEVVEDVPVPLAVEVVEEHEPNFPFPSPSVAPVSAASFPPSEVIEADATIQETLVSPSNLTTEFAKANWNAARVAGEATFQGRSCERGHSGLRYTANRQCVVCADINKAARDARMAAERAPALAAIQSAYEIRVYALSTAWKTGGAQALAIALSTTEEDHSCPLAPDATLAERAGQIHNLLSRESENPILAGFQLLVAQARVIPGKWEKWCVANLPGHGQRKISRAMWFARSRDPIATHADQVTKQRERRNPNTTPSLASQFPQPTTSTTHTTH